MEDNFSSKLGEAASKIEEALKAHNELTAWDLKLKFKMSASLLYLSLGFLSALGKIELLPDELNYRVRIKKNS
ncbi:MAG: hypothetical protein GX447_02290 [Elusimicrobia bacterium]|nr:hypothetical protein [Elusimicrobiota bacterium]